MREGGIRDDVAPWSFFLPVTLAVIVGGVAAGLIGRGIDAVFRSDGGGELSAPAAAAGPARPARGVDEVAQPGASAADRAAGGPGSTVDANGEAMVAGPAPAPAAAGAAPDPAGAPGHDALSAPPVPADGSASASGPAVPVLPGAIVARRDGAPEACINGTIATRDANGWQQRLENDAPVACTEASVAPR